MSRSECLGKSSSGDQRQLAVDVTSAHSEMCRTNDKVGEKTVTDKSWSLPARALPRPVQVSCKDTQKSEFPSGEVNTDEHSPKKSTNTSSRVEEHVQSTAEADEELETKDQDAENDNVKAPVELIMEFLRSVMGKDFQLASRLCQMILTFEPDNPEASEFLPLIKKKLLKAEQEAEQSTEEEEEDEDDDEDDDDDDDKENSESDEDSSQSSICSTSSCSSPSQSDEDEEEEKRWSRHKPCPPSH